MSYLHPFFRARALDDRRHAFLRWHGRGRVLALFLALAALPTFLIDSIDASWGGFALLLAGAAALAVRALPDWYRCEGCGTPADDETGQACPRCRSRAA